MGAAESPQDYNIPVVEPGNAAGLSNTFATRIIVTMFLIFLMLVRMVVVMMVMTMTMTMVVAR